MRTVDQQFSLVPKAGLEPAQPLWPRDFKSLVSTIPPFRQPFGSKPSAKLGNFFELKKKSTTKIHLYPVLRQIKQ